jgi:hypothetical protein
LPFAFCLLAFGFAFCFGFGHASNSAMSDEKRIIDNRNRPAQPEPGEDPATQIPAVREEAAKEIRGGRREVDKAEAEERARQTGEATQEE